MSAADEIVLPASLHTALDVFDVEACKLSNEIGVSIDDIKMIRSMTLSLFEVMAQRSRDGQDTNEEKRAETKTSKIQRLTKENEKLKKRLKKIQEAASEDRKIIQKQNKLIALQSDINTQQKKFFDIKSSKAMEVVEAQIQAVNIMSKMSTSTLEFFDKFNQRDCHDLSKFYKYLD
jgi:septal ring factor EnvC (AmiA/AmiB activator)